MPCHECRYVISQALLTSFERADSEEKKSFLWCHDKLIHTEFKIQVIFPSRLAILINKLMLCTHLFIRFANFLENISCILNSGCINLYTWTSTSEKVALDIPVCIKQLIDWLLGLMTHQPLCVILCSLPEKGRKEIEEIVEEMKERDREERGTGMKRKKQKSSNIPLYPYLLQG